MIIAIDYDETYTRDPLLWNWFCGEAIERGHKVLCVTARSPRHLDEVQQTIGAVIGAGNCIATDSAPKAAHVWKHHDTIVDVWVDDTPGSIEGDWEAYGGFGGAEA